MDETDGQYLMAQLLELECRCKEEELEIVQFCEENCVGGETD